MIACSIYLIRNYIGPNKMYAYQSSWRGIAALRMFLFTVGHGYFDSHQDYLLACKQARAKNRLSTSIPARALASTLRTRCRGKRLFVILDCCFAGNALPEFMAPVEEVAQKLASEELPAAGTALFLAASKDQAAIAIDRDGYTMFSGSL